MQSVGRFDAKGDGCSTNSYARIGRREAGRHGVLRRKWICTAPAVPRASVIDDKYGSSRFEFLLPPSSQESELCPAL